MTTTDRMRAVEHVEGLYRFAWAGEDESTPGRRRFAGLNTAVSAAVARAVAKLPDGFLESGPVSSVIMTALPSVLRLRFHSRLATTVTGVDFSTRSAVGFVFADGQCVRFLVDVQGRRCRVAKIPNDQVAARAEAGMDMPMPKLLRMFVGADIHPALLIDNGDIEIWGDVFVVARLIPIFGIPPRSLLPGGGMPTRSP